MKNIKAEKLYKKEHSAKYKVQDKITNTILLYIQFILIPSIHRMYSIGIQFMYISFILFMFVGLSF
jgi:hypothetical protein